MKYNRIQRIQIWRAVGLLLLFTIGLSASGYGQGGKLADFYQDKVSTEDISKTIAEKLKTIVALKKGSQKLVQALQSISRQTGLNLSYSEQVIPYQKKVIIKRAKMPAKQALWAVLEGTGYRFGISASGQLVLMKMQITSPPVQQETITGTVTDGQSGETLPGVNILVKGTTTGTSTGSEGNFELTVPSLQDTLVVSFIGYQTTEVPIQGRTDISIEMQSQTITGEEMVVIGYGTQTRKDLTGAISEVKPQELNAVPTFNATQGLKGRVAGVQVSKNSGAPGGNISVRIRGSNSINGNNEPLYVVDGFPIIGGIDYLNPSDIESMSVLKDASATAIYGARASNGVVIITTKSGEKNTEGRIEIGSYYGTQKSINRYHMLNAKQYATVSNAWLEDAGTEPYWSQDEIEALGKGTDWWNETISPAPVHNHTLRFSGGGENTVYSLSGNYYGEEGLLVNSNAKRGNVRLNLNHDVNDRVKLGLNLSLGRNKVSTYPINNSDWHNGILGAPSTLSVYNESGNFTNVGHIYSWTLGNIPNPLIFTSPYKNKTLRNSVNVNSSVEFEITDHLSFKTRNGLDYENNRIERFAPSDRGYNDIEGEGGYIRSGSSESNSFLTANTFNYLNTFDDKHKFDIVGGVTYQTYENNTQNIEGNKLASNLTKNYNIGVAGLIHTPSSGVTEWSLLSGLARVNYSFKSKYFITGSIRADGSSRFGVNNKWGIFPSGAVAWNLANEPFMNNVGFISNLKIRASYGITGSTTLNPYQTIKRLSTQLAVFGGNSNTIGYAPSNIGNPDLKWETTNQLDIGIDLSVLEARLNFNLDYYKKVTTNLLATVPLPTSTGYSSTLKNIGEIENRGFELGVSANILQQEFQWNINANASTNKNTLKELAGGDDITGGSFGHPYDEPLNIMREGEPYGSFYGLLSNGLDEEGYYKYKDVTGDGSVNSEDRVIIGNPNPKFIFSLTNDFSYKNFGLNIFIEGTQGKDVFWATSGVHIGGFVDGHNQFAEYFGNYWTPENPDAKYQKPSGSSEGKVSDRAVKDGSYLRLKSLTLSYQIPVTKVSFVKEANIYIRGTNLYTLTDYPGLDPDVNTRGNGIFRGVDQDAYPSVKTYTVGAKIGF